MARIAVNKLFGPVWYDSFADVVTDLTAYETFGGKIYNQLPTFIDDIVLFNVCYRDILRKEGLDKLLTVLFEEAPTFKNESEAIEELRKKVEEWGPLGNYDIQCLSVKDSFTVFGHRFNGLNSVWQSVEVFQRDERYMFKRDKFVSIPGIHVLCNYEPYPQFDSSDADDDREYCNYFFLQRPFSDADCALIEAIPNPGNNEKYSDSLENVDEMPMLYYGGTGEAMILVTPKENGHE